LSSLEQVHAQWFRNANVPELFAVSLRHVTLYDKSSNIPISQLAHLRVHGSSVLSLISQLPSRFVSPPSEAMLVGPRPAALSPEAVKKARSANTTLPSLVLVHGWCAQIQARRKKQTENICCF
jgi:hypothetical protein